MSSKTLWSSRSISGFAYDAFASPSRVTGSSVGFGTTNVVAMGVAEVLGETDGAGAETQAPVRTIATPTRATRLLTALLNLVTTSHRRHLPSVAKRMTDVQ